MGYRSRWKCEMNISPENIQSLKSNEVFVFGSNIQGRHGKGAALHALRFGAVYGKGIGYIGKTYAVPTREFIKDSTHWKLVSIALSRIVYYIQDFIGFVSIHKELHFLLTPIGCGHAGYTPKQIAPLFSKAKDYENISWPRSFIEILG
jgi:hypothetical protein